MPILMLMRIILIFVSLIFFSLTAHAQIATLTGLGAAHDGDGIKFGKVEVRLQGIAAPELHDKGGIAAKAALHNLIKGKTVRCELDGTLARKRPVGVCFVDGVDVGESLIKDGFARDCPRFSGGRYAEAEHTAKQNGATISETYKLPRYCNA